MTHDRPIRRALMIARKHREYGGADGTSTPTFDGTVVAGPPVLPSTTEPPSGPIQYIANIPPRIAETVRTIRSAASNVTPADVAQIAKSITFPDLMRGIGYNAYDILGAPVDLAAQATKVASHALPQAAFERVQRGLEKPILGSEWWREKAIEAGIAEPPKGTPGELIGEIGAGFVDPATVGKSVSLLAAKASPLLAVPMPAFKLHSGAADLIEKKGQPKATPQQYAAMPGIKPDELKYAGFDRLGNKALPREDVVRHLEENAIPIKETVKQYRGDVKAPTSDDEMIANTLSDQVHGPKHERYTLPGGKKYREVLLHLPETNEHRDDFYAKYHWDEPNVLAHIRMSDRKGPNGEKVLHVEELQSDWGQQGREKGFHKPPLDKNDVEYQRIPFKQYEDEDKRLAEYMRKWRRENGHPENAPVVRYRLRGANDWNSHGDPNKTHDDILQLARADRSQHSQFGERNRQASQGVPAGPYVDNTQKWTDLALKRVLHEAAHGGYDKVVFTPGDEQNKRYSLSKHVDELHYSPSEKKLLYKPKNQLGYAEKEIAPGDLPGAIGKEVAERLLATEPAQNWNTGSMAPLHSIKGKDLEVGGGGMRGYYDNIMPKRLQALAQQHDPQAKVRLKGERIKTHGEWPFPIEVSSDGTNYWLSGRSPHNEEPKGRLSENFSSYIAADDARKKMYSGYNQPVHALDVTPQMRDSIKAKGFNQFKRGGEVEPRRGAHPLVSHALKLTARKR